MPIKSRQFAKINENDILSISLSLATSNDVKEWSNGEIINPETINYKTYKPEKGGLFDEVIFGPTTDFKCPICGTKYKRSNEGQICEKTDECKMYQPQILPASTRRTRMAHIELASPVVHFWFFKIDHSIIAKLLGLKVEGSAKVHSKSSIEDLIYFKSHIVLEDGGLKSLPKNEIIEINRAAIIYRDALLEIKAKYAKDSEAYEDITFAINDLEEMATSKIGKDYGIDFYELNEIIEEYSDAKIGTGAKAVEYLLENFDIKLEIKRVKAAISKITKEISASKDNSETKVTQRAKLYKRLEILNAFASSGQDLKAMLVYSLPVIPADLRPLIQIDGGRHSTTDVNELYRRIIIRNNRLKKWQELDAPVLIVQNELRMLQEAVDALFDNSRKKPSPVLSKDGRPLKSISDALSGKKGRFRQNLLGKRVDYSGRSVIVVGPELKMHQAGIPRQMAAKLFEPWIIKELVRSGQASSIKAAKKLIEEQDNVIWPFVEETIKGKVVLLNRAPTLHRLSIQAFEPTLVRGKAIRLHPLVTTAFNADFDGDQMAVHVPISPKAIREAKELMLANKNILGPKDGEPIINPSQDMILGLFYLTKEVKGAKGEGHYYGTFEEMYKAYDLGHIDLHARIALPVSAVNKQYLDGKNGYVVTTVGKFIFNTAFPKNFPIVFNNSTKTLSTSFSDYIVPFGTDIKAFIEKLEINKALAKKDIARVAREVFNKYVASVAKEDVASVLATVNSSNANDTIMQYGTLKDHEGNSLNKIHSQILSQLTKEKFAEINKRIMLTNEGVERVFETNERVELLEKVWFDYTNVVANALDNIKNLGFKYSMISGTTVSIADIKLSGVKAAEVKKGEVYVSQLRDMVEKGLITSDEKYELSKRKWSEVKDKVQEDLKKLPTLEENKNNPIFMMMESGARGNISNFVQLAGMRGLMANTQKVKKAQALNNMVVRNVIEVPVKSSFLEGLTSFEFYSSTHGARKGLTDTALNTANAGYLTRRLVDVAQDIVVKEADCGTSIGTLVKSIMDTKTGTVIVPMKERIEGRFSAEEIKDAKGNVIVSYNDLISAEIADKIIAANIDGVMIRSVFGCQTPHGVCKKCYGKDLATNRVVQIGEPVGIVAAQSIGEPGTQLTMRTFHTGGVAGGEDITGGFDRLKQLIDATRELWGHAAILSKTKGKVVSIEAEEDSQGNKTGYTLVKVDSHPSYYRYETKRRIRVKVGTEVSIGQKIVEGQVIFEQLLEYAGKNALQLHLLKEIQRLYKMQGISISDKYVEIIVRQMLSKILIKEPGDSKFFAGSLIDIHEYKAENTRLLVKGKTPAFGTLVIRGAKQIPLLSKSFLAAASYQETAKVLVHASIAGQVDSLDGLKENIIVGHKIPAGTAAKFEAKGKFDIKDSRDYFSNNK